MARDRAATMLLLLLLLMMMLLQTAHGTLTIQYPGGNATLPTWTFMRGPLTFSVSAPLVVADSPDLETQPVQGKIVVADYLICASALVWSRACAKAGCAGLVIVNLAVYGDWNAWQQDVSDRIPSLLPAGPAVLDLAAIRSSAPALMATMDSVQYASPTPTEALMNDFAARFVSALLALANATLLLHLSVRLLAFSLSETGNPRRFPSLVAVVGLSQIAATTMRLVYLINVGVGSLRWLSLGAYQFVTYERFQLASLSNVFMAHALYTNMNVMSKERRSRRCWLATVSVVLAVVVLLSVLLAVQSFVPTFSPNIFLLMAAIILLTFVAAVLFIAHGRRLAMFLLKPSQLSDHERARSKRFARNIALIGWVQLFNLIVMLVGLTATVTSSTTSTFISVKFVCVLETILSYLHLNGFIPRPSIVHKVTMLLSSPDLVTRRASQTTSPSRNAIRNSRDRILATPKGSITVPRQERPAGAPSI